MSESVVFNGSKFKHGNGDDPLTYTEIAEISSFDGLDGQSADIDVTNVQSGAREYKSGLKDSGTVQLGGNWIPDDEKQIALETAQKNGTLEDFEIELNNAVSTAGTKINFQGYVKQFSLSGGVDDVWKVSISIRITGDWTRTAAE